MSPSIIFYEYINFGGTNQIQIIRQPISYRDPPCSGSVKLRMCADCSSRRPCLWRGCYADASHTPAAGGRLVSLGLVWRSIGMLAGTSTASSTGNIVVITKRARAAPRQSMAIFNTSWYVTFNKYQLKNFTNHTVANQTFTSITFVKDQWHTSSIKYCNWSSQGRFIESNCGPKYCHND